MFTGIIETLGQLQEVSDFGANRSFWVKSSLLSQFKVDQSLSHNGVCLTIEEIGGECYKVTAVAETLAKTTLGTWKTGDFINLERSLLPSSRLDGHFVQGHVDATGMCKKKKDKKGSWEYTFTFPKKFAALVIEKGSISVNGISLTVFNVKKSSFTVAIIPYTYEHTNLQYVEKGSAVNLEFDIIGKYILKTVVWRK